MANINDMSFNLEGFKYDTSIDLNMGYYNIQLIENVSNLWTIILPWGKNRYNCWPMIVGKSPDIFQQKTNYLFQGSECARIYIYTDFWIW